MKTIVDDNKEPGLNPGEVLIAILDAARKTLGENGNGTSPKEETERIYTVREPLTCSATRRATSTKW